MMDLRNILTGVTTSVNDIAATWAGVQRTRNDIAASKAQAEIERATIDASRTIALANASAVKSDRVASLAPPLPSTVINTATGLSPTVLLVGGAALLGGFFLLTRK